MRQLQGPMVSIKSYTTAAPFYQAKEVSFPARCLLALASNFRTHGGNLYKLCSNEAIEKMMGLSHGQFMRAKKQLKDTNLLNYEGIPGDYSHLIVRWEQCTGGKWGWKI